MTALRNVAAVVGKEWRHYFGSPIAWVALAMWALLFGIFFYFGLRYFVEMSMRVAQQGMEMGGGGMKLSLHDYPIDAVRELVVNGMIHRSYETHGTVDVEHTGDQLTISSPGGFVAGGSPENILTYPSTPRNRLPEMFSRWPR